MGRGAGAFVVKDQITTHADYLVRVIKKVVKKGRYRLFLPQNEQTQLTFKQIELIAHMIEGNSKGDIANSLGISLSAVEKGEKRIMAKYNAKSRIGLIVEMVEKGYQFFFQA